MPYAMSDYLESGLLNMLLRDGTFSKPATVAIALCTAVPYEYQNGATIPELPNTGGYARKINCSGDAFWNQNVHGSGSNIAETLWANASANWGYVSGVALVDSATYGAGNVLFYGALNNPRIVLNGDAFKFNAGSLTVILD